MGRTCGTQFCKKKECDKGYEKEATVWAGLPWNIRGYTTGRTSVEYKRIQCRQDL